MKSYRKKNRTFSSRTGVVAERNPAMKEAVSQQIHVKKEKITDTFPGYPVYPPEEDIYQEGQKKIDLDPENPKKSKEAVGKNRNENEEDADGIVIGSDLDVPGAELDDEQEKIGNEDEENNYYSLGGENHKNLDEDKNEVPQVILDPYYDKSNCKDHQNLS